MARSCCNNPNFTQNPAELPLECNRLWVAMLIASCHFCQLALRWTFSKLFFPVIKNRERRDPRSGATLVANV